MWAAVLACGFGCAGERRITVAAVPHDAHPDGGSCAAVQRRANGTCCADGQAYTFATDTCAPVGPRSCATSVFAAPADCTPTWCFDDRGSEGQPCTGQADCRPVARQCSDAEAAAGAGCAAGTLGAFGPQKCFDAGSGLQQCVGDAIPSAALGGTCVAVGVDWQCPAGFAAEATSCVPKTSDCGSDLFGGVADAPGTVFVDASVAKDGNGTRDSPLHSLNHALYADSLPTTIVLAAGTYTESNLIERPVKIVGRCAALVRMVGKGDAAALWFEGPEKGDAIAASVVGVTIGGPAQAVVVAGGAHVALTNVWLRQAHGTGLLVLGGKAHTARATAVDSVVADTLAVRADPSGAQELGRGIEVSEGGQAALSGTLVAGSTGVGIAVGGQGSAITGSAVAVRGVAAGTDTGGNGHCLRALDGGTIALATVSAVDCVGVAVEAAGPQSKIALSKAHVAGAHARPSDAEGGFGVEALDGATLDLNEVLLRDNHHVGISVWGAGARLSAKDVVVRGTQPTAAGHYGRGLQVVAGGRVDWVGGAVAGNRDIGVVVTGKDSIAALTGVRVTGTLPNAVTQDWGRGIDVSGGAQVTLTACRIDGNRDVGVAAWDPWTVVSLQGTVVAATLPRALDGQNGHGVVARDDARVSLLASLLIDNHTAAAVVYQAQLVAEDSVFAKTHQASYSLPPPAPVLLVGDGVLAAQATYLALTNCVAAACARVGVLVDGGATPQISGLASTGSQFGVATQGGTVWQSSGAAAWDNQQDRKIDGGLGVPLPPAPAKQ